MDNQPLTKDVDLLTMRLDGRPKLTKGVSPMILRLSSDKVGFQAALLTAFLSGTPSDGCAAHT
ncbi:MAG: hypothetical protein J2P52_10390, partial [Blastocatellia bacterium]|nr:hypothetical protein [Blastocatellia bacterium]